MKKLILIFAVLSLMACRKRNCYSCTYTVVATGQATTKTVTEVCDKTKKEAAAIEDAGSQRSSSGSVQVVTVMR